jgi:hypothetical protein
LEHFAEKLILPGIGAYKYEVKCKKNGKKGSINLHLEGNISKYRKTQSHPLDPESLELPFEGKLSADNRWVIMANLIPWPEFEGEYAKFTGLRSLLDVAELDLS